MQSLSDYFQLGAINTVPDYLVFAAVIIFIVGVVSIAFDPIRINKKSRYYFYLAIILFGIAVYMGWYNLDQDIIRAWENIVG